MNSLIQRLVDQAKQNVPAGLAPEEWLSVYHKTFAQLVAKECADIAVQTHSGWEAGMRITEAFEK